MEQFKQSLAEVINGKIDDRPDANLSIKPENLPKLILATPNAAYLNTKRGSVFHRAFDSGGQAIKEFVPPVYPKPEESQTKLIELFTNSFLTKSIDSKNHLVLAQAMFSRNFVSN